MGQELGGDDAERRQDRRRRITLQVEYPGRQGYRVDWIESASPGGLFLRTNDRHRVGDQLRLALTLPGFGQSIEVDGEVAWIRHESEDSPAGVGIRIGEQEYFDGVSELIPLTATREFSLTSGPYSRLAALPRVRLAQTPTPLHRAERLSKALGGPDIWIKRDDMTGFGLGGNMVRKLELIAADAQAQGADTLVTGAKSVQSEHVRMTMTVARHLGMHPVVVVPRGQIEAASSNLLVDEILGTEYVEAPIDAGSVASVDDLVEAALPELERRGRKPYLVSRGGASPLGACGYVLASIELAGQLKRLSLEPDVVVVAHGSAGTQAGLVVGQRWLDASYEVLGVSVDLPAFECSQRVALLGGEVESMLKISDTLPVDDIWVNDDYIGPGFGQSTSQAVVAIGLVAQTEGIFLDPIYTGKAMAGLVDLIRRGEIGRGQTVVFWHTGGWPALFA